MHASSDVLLFNQSKVLRVFEFLPLASVATGILLPFAEKRHSAALIIISSPLFVPLGNIFFFIKIFE